MTATCTVWAPDLPTSLTGNVTFVTSHGSSVPRRKWFLLLPLGFQQLPSHGCMTPPTLWTSRCYSPTPHKLPSPKDAKTNTDKRLHTEEGL